MIQVCLQTWNVESTLHSNQISLHTVSCCGHGRQGKMAEGDNVQLANRISFQVPTSTITGFALPALTRNSLPLRTPGPEPQPPGLDARDCFPTSHHSFSPHVTESSPYSKIRDVMFMSVQLLSNFPKLMTRARFPSPAPRKKEVAQNSSFSF